MSRRKRWTAAKQATADERRKKKAMARARTKRRRDRAEQKLANRAARVLLSSGEASVHKDEMTGQIIGWKNTLFHG